MIKIYGIEVTPLKTVDHIKVAWNEYLRSIQENTATFYTSLQETVDITGITAPSLVATTTAKHIRLDLLCLFPALRHLKTNDTCKELTVVLTSNLDRGTPDGNGWFSSSSTVTNNYALLQMSKFVVRPIISMVDPLFMWSDRSLQASYLPRFEFVNRVINMDAIGKSCSLRLPDTSSAFTNVCGIYVYCRQPNMTAYNDVDNCLVYSGPDWLGITLSVDGSTYYDHSNVNDIVHRRRQANITQLNVWGNQFLPEILTPNNVLQTRHIIGTYIDFGNIYRDSQNADDVLAMLTRATDYNIEVTVTAMQAMHATTTVTFCLVCNDKMVFSPNQINLVQVQNNY